jgi:hypothetical protein
METIHYKGHEIKEYEKDFYIVNVENDSFKLTLDSFGRVARIQFIKFPKSTEELLDIVQNLEFLDSEFLAGPSVPSKRDGIWFTYRNPPISSRPIPANSGKNIGEYHFREGIQYGSGSSSEYASMQFYTPDLSKVHWMPTRGIKTTLKKEGLTKRMGLSDYHSRLLVDAYENARL